MLGDFQSIDHAQESGFDGPFTRHVLDGVRNGRALPIRKVRVMVALQTPARIVSPLPYGRGSVFNTSVKNDKYRGARFLG